MLDMVMISTLATGSGYEGIRRFEGGHWPVNKGSAARAIGTQIKARPGYQPVPDAPIYMA